MVAKEEGEADRAASLARLRLFLAAHAPPPAKQMEKTDASSSADDSTQTATDCQQVKAASPDSEHAVDASDTGATPPASDASTPLQAAPSAETNAPATDNTAINNSLPAPLLSPDDLSAADHDLRQNTITAAGGAAASVRSLSPASKEYARVKYLLQCCLPGRRVLGDVAMCDMQNPALIAQYARHATGLLDLDSWVAVNDLGANLSEMHDYGFTSVGDSATAMKFTTGMIHLGDSDDVGKTEEGRVRQLVLCKIAVGRSLVVRCEEDARRALPPGYHSFHVQTGAESVGYRSSSQQPEDEQRHEEAQQQRASARSYYHEYILTNPHQILPQFLVRFRVSALEHDNTNSNTVETCGMCEKQSASVACKACAADLCASCDEQVHSANKIVSRHVRSPIRPRQPQATTESGVASTAQQLADLLSSGLSHSVDDESMLCRAHKHKRVEFFCIVCDVPVCVNCKMVGDHSVGEKGAHRLLTISDAYEACLRETLRPDPLLDSRRAVIDSKLRTLRSLAENVASNRHRVREAIEAQYRRALQQLDACVAGKMSAIGSEMCEFERQAQQLDWVDTSLERTRSTLGAVEFLAAWKQHKLLRADHHDFPSLSVGGSAGAEQVKPDLELVGELHVMSTEQMMYRGSWTSRDGDVVDADPAEVTESNVPNESEVDGALSLAPFPMGQRLSDSQIRRRLVTMKTLPLPAPGGLSSPFRGCSTTVPASSPSRPLSPSCQKVLEGIKTDLLTRYATANNNSPSRVSMARTATLLSRDQPTRSGSGCASPTMRLAPGQAMVLAAPTVDTLDAMRGFSVLPVRRKLSGSMSPAHTAPSPGGRQRFNTDAWSTLLRMKLGGAVDASATTK